MERLRLRALGVFRRFPGIIWLLGVASFVNVAGLSLLWPVNSIYIHTVLHKPLTIAGLVLMVYSGAGFLGSFFGGWLYDRYGAFRVLTTGLCVAGLTILIPDFTSGWWAYVGVMAAFGIACAAPFPVLNALVGQAWPEGGRRGYNFIYVANNLGVAVGTALGGVLAEWSFHAVFVGISVSYLVFFVLVMTVFRSHFAAVRPTSKETTDAARLVTATDLPVVPWVPILIMFSGFVLAWAVYVQWQCTISVYMQSLGYRLSSYSLLWTLNGLLIFGLQPLVAIVVRRFSSLSVQMVGGVIFYAAGYAIVATGHGYPTFVAGMCVMTIGELFVWPSVPAAVAQLTPSHRLGLLQGLVGSAATLGRMIGPVIGGYLYDRVDHTTLLWCFVIGTVAPFLFFLVFHYFYSKYDVGGVAHPQQGVAT
jgi:MFS family permease